MTMQGTVAFKNNIRTTRQNFMREFRKNLWLIDWWIDCDWLCGLNLWKKVIIAAGMKTPLRKHVYIFLWDVFRLKRWTWQILPQFAMDIFKFWIHLENQPPDSIAKLCWNIWYKMAQESKSGLINETNLLCMQLNVNKQSVNFNLTF